VKGAHQGNAGLLADTTVIISCSPWDDGLARRVADSLDQGARHVVVDLGDAEMVDSSTLTTLRRFASKLRSHGGRLSVVCGQPALSRLLELTLLSRSFDVFGSLDAALRTS
jgi:anti-anti-sigma factor